MESIRTSYKTYKEVEENPIGFKDYIDINKLYLSFLAEKILKGDEITLPGKMGTVFIFGTEQKIYIKDNGEIKGLAPDWQKTIALWNKDPLAKEKKKLVYCTNDHSSNIKYRFKWNKKNVYVTNKTIYSLKMSRENKRLLSKLVKQGKEYINYGKL